MAIIDLVTGMGDNPDALVVDDINGDLMIEDATGNVMEMR